MLQNLAGSGPSGPPDISALMKQGMEGPPGAHGGNGP